MDPVNQERVQTGDSLAGLTDQQAIYRRMTPAAHAGLACSPDPRGRASFARGHSTRSAPAAGHEQTEPRGSGAECVEWLAR